MFPQGTEAELAFADTLADSGKEIFPEEGTAGTAEDGRDERTAEAFARFVNTDEGFDDVVRGFYEELKAAGPRGETDGETTRNERTRRRVEATVDLRNGNWKSAFASIGAGKPVNQRTKQILRSMMGRLPLQYMEAWALVKGDDTWLPGENDIARIKRLDTEGLLSDEYLEGLNPHQLERLAGGIKDQKVRQKIEDGSLRYDDPDIEAYDKKLREDQAEADRKLKLFDADFTDRIEMVRRLEENVRKERLAAEQLERESAARDIEGEGKTQALAAARKHRQKLGKAEAEAVRARQVLAQTIDDIGWKGHKNHREILALLKERDEAEEQLRSIEETRKALKQYFRLVMKKPDLNTIHTKEARQIDWLRSHFDSYTWIAKFIGPRARSVEELYRQFAADAEGRRKLKGRIGDLSYSVIENIVFKRDGSIRPYGEITAAQRRLLRKKLVDHKSIFDELGIDTEEELPSYSPAEYAAILAEIQDRFPPALLSKLTGLTEKDGDGKPLARLRDFTMEDMQALANIANQIRKEGRADYEARREARRQLIEEEREAFLAQIRKFLPKGAADKIAAALPGSGAEKLEEEKRGWRHIAYALINARRFFRMLEGGEDGALYYAITRREYAAFEQENRRTSERHEKVERELQEAGVKLKDLGKTVFEGLEGPDGKVLARPLTLDEMLSIYYAQFNERAFHAVAFGNFASQAERDAIRDSKAGTGYGAEGLTPEALLAQTEIEAKITARYWAAVRRLEEFLAGEGNGKYRQVMEIIGRDFDGNYGRLRDFVANEYNMELGSEPYYMPLRRTSLVAQENNDVEAALAEHGLSRYINKGFSKNRIDIAPENQQGVRLGFYALWDDMVAKQEHLMAYDGLMREMKQVFEGRGSEALRDTLKKGYGGAGVDYVRKFTSELAKPTSQVDSEALSRITRLMRGHYSAAVLGWRLSSILKQALQSPAPFWQYVNPGEYYAAMASCLDEGTRDSIKEKSAYLKARYFDPAGQMVKEMSRLALQGKLGKAEAALTKLEQIGMMGQGWIDAVAVMPGWLAAYRRKLAELNRTAGNMEATLKAAGISGEVVTGANLISMAEKVWAGDKTAERVDFTPSEKLKTEIQKLTGNSLEKIVVTDSDVRHIKKEHGQNEASRGQVDITPEDIALIPFVMNEFDEANIDYTITAKDGEKLSRLEFKKQINGTAYVATIERSVGGKSQQIVTLYKTKSKAANAATATPTGTSKTRLASTETIQRAEALRNSKRRLGELELMTPAEAEAEAIAFADQVVRDCQPSSVAMDQIPLLRDMKRNPLGQALAAFQTPMAVIFQQLFVDAPNDFKHGRVLHGLWTYALYAGLAALTVGVFEGLGGDDDDDKPLPGKIGMAAALGLVDSIPVIGGDLAYQADSFYRTGKFRVYGGSGVPLVDSMTRAGNAMSEGDWGKALMKSTDALFYLTGLPAGLKGEIERSFERRDITILLGNKRPE